MNDKYKLIIDWGEVSEDRKLPENIYSAIKNSKLIKWEFVKGRLKISGDHYMIQSFVKNQIAGIVEWRTKHHIDYREFDNVRAVDTVNKLWSMVQEDWSFDLKMRWNDMQKDIVDILYYSWGYSKVDRFIYALMRENPEFTRSQIDTIIQMSETIMTHFADIRYGRLFDQYHDKTDLKFPTTISW